MRNYILEGKLSGNRQGLSLFVREGFASWVDKSSTDVNSPAPPAPEEVCKKTQNGLVWEKLQDEIVNILMEMTMSNIEGAMP